MVVDDTSLSSSSDEDDLNIYRAFSDGTLLGEEKAPGLHISLSQLAFGKRTLFSDFELDVPAGKTTCILGPSGVGKTTILKTIAGFIPLAAGSSITASDGRSVQDRLAYMDQRDLLLPWASVLENIVIGDKLQGRKAAYEKAERFLQDLDLQEYRHDRPDKLSGGMRQRIALARTLMGEHPIVLVDEPFSALDAITRHRLQQRFVSMMKNRTVLMITHDPLEALRVAHRIYIMRDRPVNLSDPISPHNQPPRQATEAQYQAALDRILYELGLTEEDW